MDGHRTRAVGQHPEHGEEIRSAGMQRLVRPRDERTSSVASRSLPSDDGDDLV